MINSIGIFCSSYVDIEESFFDDARLLASWIGSNKKNLVYGGTNKGMMNVFAETVKASGGTVTGVIPQTIIDRGFAFKALDKMVVTTSLSERKDLLISNSDIIIAMPGGFGTLDEAFSTIAQRKLRFHDKELIFCNTNGIFDELIASLEKLYSSKFAPTVYKEYYKVFNSAQECIEYLKELDD